MIRVFVILFLVTLNACSTTTTVDEIRQSPNSLDVAAGDALVILGRHDAGHYETDLNFVECVGEQLSEVSELDVLAEPSFLDAMFPWFEPRTAPKSLRRMQRLLEEPQISEKLNELNLRYLVWLDGHTENINKAGSMSCSAGVGGAGCLGVLSWDRLSVYEAMVWNIPEMKEEGRVRVDSEGSNYVIGALVPIPLLTQAKGDACKGMGTQLRSFFESES